MTAEKRTALLELVGETMRLGMRILVLWAAVAEWGWLRGLGAAMAVLLLEDALIKGRGGQA